MIKILTTETLLGTIETVEIENADGSFTQMLKSVYEEKWGPIENE